MQKQLSDFQQFLLVDVVEFASYIWHEWCRQKLALVIFFGLSLNFTVVPWVYAATGKVEPRHLYAIGGLGLIILGMVIYLFDVVFRPERY